MSDSPTDQQRPSHPSVSTKLRYALGMVGVKILHAFPFIAGIVAPRETRVMRQFFRHAKLGHTAVQPTARSAVIGQIHLATCARGRFPSLATSTWQQRLHWEGRAEFEQSLASAQQGVILVTGYSMLEGAVERYAEEHPRGDHILGAPHGRTDESPSNSKPRTPTSPMQLARNFVLAQRALREGKLILASGNTISTVGNWTHAPMLGRNLTLPSGWARLAIASDCPVWFILGDYQPRATPTLRFVCATPPAAPVTPEAWVNCFAAHWEDSLRRAPALARPRWIRRWLKSPHVSAKDR